MSINTLSNRNEPVSIDMIATELEEKNEIVFRTNKFIYCVQWSTAEAAWDYSMYLLGSVDLSKNIDKDDLDCEDVFDGGLLECPTAKDIISFILMDWED